MKEFVLFLEKYKKIVGLSDWKILVQYDDSVKIARAGTDIYEKVFHVYVSDNFLDMSKERQRNILIHELIHGRLAIYHQLKDKFLTFLEEDLVNDITRGFELVGEFEELN